MTPPLPSPPDEPVSVAGASRQAMVEALTRLGAKDVEQLAAVWTNDFAGVTVDGAASDPISGGSTNMLTKTIAAVWYKSPLIAAVESRSPSILARVASALPSWAASSVDEEEEEEEKEESEPFQVRDLTHLRFVVGGGRLD